MKKQRTTLLTRVNVTQNRPNFLQPDKILCHACFKGDDNIKHACEGAHIPVILLAGQKKFNQAQGSKATNYVLYECRFYPLICLLQCCLAWNHDSLCLNVKSYDIHQD